MADENEKKRISFECHKDSDFTFKKVKKLIREAFFDVGKTSLFDSKYQTSSSSASLPGNSDEAICQIVISASTSLPFILRGIISIRIALQNLNRVPISPKPAQERGAQKPCQTSRDLIDIKCYISGEIGHCASAHCNSEIQQPRASRALFPKDTSGSGDVVQEKLDTMVEEEDEDVMLTASVTLQDNGIKKRPQKKVTKQIASHRQLRSIYEDPQIHKTDNETSKSMDGEDDLPVGPIREANHPVFQETSANSWLPQTR